MVGELAGSLEETLDMDDFRSEGMWTFVRKEWDVASAGGVKGVVLAVMFDFLTGVLRER